MPKASPAKKLKGGKKACTVCGDYIHSNRLSMHVRKCKREEKEAEDLLQYEKEITNQLLAGFRGMQHFLLFLLHHNSNFFPQLPIVAAWLGINQTLGIT